MVLPSQDWTIDTVLLYLANCFEGTNCMKQKQFNFNKFIFTFLISNRFNTHEEATLPYPWTTQHHLIRQLYGGSNQHETHAIYGNKCNSIFVEINTIYTHMKRQHFLALGGHRIAILGQLF